MSSLTSNKIQVIIDLFNEGVTEAHNISAHLVDTFDSTFPVESIVGFVAMLQPLVDESLKDNYQKMFDEILKEPHISMHDYERLEGFYEDNEPQDNFYNWLSDHAFDGLGVGSEDCFSMLSEVRNYNYSDFDDDAEEVITDATGLKASIDVLARFSFFFFYQKGYEVDEEQLEEAEIEQVSELAAQLIQGGADFDQAVEATACEYAQYKHVEDGAGFALDESLRIFGEYLNVRDHMLKQYDLVSSGYHGFRKWCTDKQIPFYMPIEFIYLLSVRSIGELSRLSSLFMSPFISELSRMEFAPSFRTALVHSFAAFLDIIDQRHRYSPKPAWAFLMARPKLFLSRGDAMLAAFHFSSYKPPADYPEWSQRMIDLMTSNTGNADQLLTEAPTRALFFPKNTFGIKSNEDFIDGFDVTIHQTERELKRLEVALKHGASQGIDGAWLATKSSIDISLSRYTQDRPVPSLESKAKIIEAADALFDEFSEMYERPRGMSVRSVMQATIWKYSAGLPFLPLVKKRAQLKASSWYLDIELAVKRILDSGVFPGVAFHAFPKNQIIALDRYSKGKPVRTVTAADRITSIAANTLLMERNKRVPPTRALILPSFTRSEAGMAEVYKELGKHPHFYVGDGFQFDSSVSSQLAIEAPTRLWERGIAGNWGERATTSFIRAYYTAISDGFIVSLYDGTVIRKTGGGGTGSATTTPDNRDWVRIALIASWSLALKKPCIDFFSHVTLSNASDDIAFSCDDDTARNINRWCEILRTEYGVTFDMQNATLNDRILHLRVVENPNLDDYATVGVDPPSFSVRHDPERLFLMRSEYRADRMRHNQLVAANVIATQAVGHIMLTAHSREAYCDIALDWLDSVQTYLSFFFEDVEYLRQLDQNGLLVGVSISIGDGDTARPLLRLARKILNPREREKFIGEKKQQARRWARAHRLKSYIEIFEMWVVPSPKMGRAIEARYLKLKVPTLRLPMLDALRTGLHYFAATAAMYPKAFKQLAGEQDVQYLAGRYTVADFPIEKFTFWALLEQYGRAPKTPEVVRALKSSPLGNATDAFGFMSFVSTDYGHRAVMTATEGEKSSVYCRVWLWAFFYSLSDILLRYVYNTRFIGTFVAIIFVFLWDIDTLYSFLSLWWWMANGVNSLVISNLSIRDPYLILKIFSLTLASSFPLPVSMPPQIWRYHTYLSYPLEMLVVIQKAKMTIPLVAYQSIPLPGAGIERISTTLEMAYNKGEQLGLVVAGTGSGKSSILPAAILQFTEWKRIFVLMPTTLLVRAYHNKFVDSSYIFRYYKDDPLDTILPEQGIIVLTAGLFAARFHTTSATLADLRSTNRVVDQRSLILLDEPSLCTTEQIACVAIALDLDVPLFGLTGTPEGPLCRFLLSKWHIDVPFTKRYSTERRDFIDEDFATTYNHVIVELHRHEQKFESEPILQRLMISVVSIEDSERIALSIQKQLMEAHSISRSNPIAPSTGTVVATTIADFGLDLNPPATHLVDMGLQLNQYPAETEVIDVNGKIHPAKSRAAMKDSVFKSAVLYSSPSTCHQRHSRVGRNANGVIYSDPKAGSGPEVTSPINFVLFFHYSWTFLANALNILGVISPVVLQEDARLFGLFRVDSERIKQRVPDLVTSVPQCIAYCALASAVGGYDIAKKLLIAKDFELWEPLAILCGAGKLPPSEDAWNPALLRCIYSVKTKDSRARYQPLVYWSCITDSFELI